MEFTNFPSVIVMLQVVLVFMGVALSTIQYFKCKVTDFEHKDKSLSIIGVAFLLSVVGSGIPMSIYIAYHAARMDGVFYEDIFLKGVDTSGDLLGVAFSDCSSIIIAFVIWAVITATFTIISMLVIWRVTKSPMLDKIPLTTTCFWSFPFVLLLASSVTMLIHSDIQVSPFPSDARNFEVDIKLEQHDLKLFDNLCESNAVVYSRVKVSCFSNDLLLLSSAQRLPVSVIVVWDDSLETQKAIIQTRNSSKSAPPYSKDALAVELKRRIGDLNAEIAKDNKRRVSYSHYESEWVDSEIEQR